MGWKREQGNGTGTQEGRNCGPQCSVCLQRHSMTVLSFSVCLPNLSSFATVVVVVVVIVVSSGRQVGGPGNCKLGFIGAHIFIRREVRSEGVWMRLALLKTLPHATDEGRGNCGTVPFFLLVALKPALINLMSKTCTRGKHEESWDFSRAFLLLLLFLSQFSLWLFQFGDRQFGRTTSIRHETAERGAIEWRRPSLLICLCISDDQTCPVKWHPFSRDRSSFPFFFLVS